MVAQDLTRGRGTRALLTAASLIVVVAGLRAGAPLILPLLVALFFTVISLPMLNWMTSHGVRVPLAVLVTVLGVFGILSALGFLISGTVNQFAQAAPGYADQLAAKVRDALQALESRDIPVSDWLTFERVDPQSLVSLAGRFLGGTVKGVASALSYLTLVLVIMIFMLSEAVGFSDKLALALGARDRAPEYFSAIISQIERYIAIKTALSVTTGVVVGLWVAVLGVPFPLLWALVAFLFNYIPNIGSILAAIPPVLLTLAQYGLGRGVLVALGYLVVNFVLGNLVEPRWMGRSFGLSTLVVFLSLVFWGWLWGPLGMVLSVPLTVVFRIILEHSERLRWVAVLLGPNPPPDLVPRGEEARGGK